MTKQILKSSIFSRQIEVIPQHLLQAENIAILFFDEQGIIKQYSLGFEKMMGFSKNFFKDKPLYSLPFSKIEELLGFPELDSNLTDSQTFRKIKFISGTGEIESVDLHLNISRKGEKIEGGSIMIEKNIIEKSKENFSEFLLTKSEFHLKEPLRISKMFSEMLKEKARKQNDREIKEFTFFISKNLEKLDLLLNHLITLENLNFKKTEPTIINTELLWLLQLQKQKDAKDGNPLKVEFGEYANEVIGDKGLFKMLFKHILQFAENYILEGKKNLTFTSEKEENWQLLHFVFNGLEFIDNHKFSAIAPIHRAIDISTLPASGYELMIINKIVELMNGELHIELLKNNKTHLKLKLPSRLEQVQ